MALTTYAELKTAAATWAIRSDLTDLIPDFITWAHQEVCRRLRSNVMLASADLTVNAETINQPTGYLALRSLYLDTTPRREVTPVSIEQAVLASADYSSATYPSLVAKQGTLLRFAPQFTGSATGKAVYYKAPVEMAADADTNTVYAAYPFLYLYGTLEALYAYLEDTENQQKFGGQFGALIDSINTLDAKDSMSGPLVGMPYAGGIV